MINGGIATGAQMGQSPQAKPGKESLMDKFKRQPPIRKLLIVAVIAAMVFYVLDDEEAQKKPAPQPKTAAEKADRSFDALPPEKKQFVLNTYQLALDNYKNGQNEQAIRNVDQILEILPGGYREAIMTKDYAKRAIEIKRANEEERRRKEQEEKTRAEVAELVTKAQTLVEAGKDNEAKAVFAQILEKDPENPTVLRLRQEMEERDQKRKAELDAQQSREAKRKSLEAILKEARALFNAGKYYSCIEKLEDAPAIFAGNPKELAQAKALMARARQTLKEKARPHLDAANNAMIAGDYTTARDAYFRALKVDSRNAEAKKGLAKIKDILHDRAKKIYTEGVIAESLSDFKSATARYRECLNQSMPEDIYYGRCLRKTKRFEMINRDPATPGGSLDRGGMAPGPREGEEADPQMPKLPGDGGSQ
jgi:tetratricopeptide (TPR) repeat protein